MAAATSNSQALLPTARLDPYVRSRRSRTDTRRVDSGLKAYGTLIEGLAKRPPVTRLMIGRESFSAMARRFIGSEQAVAVNQLQSWEMFPNFLRSQGKTAAIEYVADVAELEMAQGKARDAANLPTLGGQAFPLLLRAEQFRLGLVLHPSVFLVSSRFPIVTIWEINKSNDADRRVHRWGAECALVARPFFDVEVRRLLPGGYAFIGALSQGRTLAEARDAGNTADPTFDFAVNRALLLEAKVVVGIRERAGLERLTA
jgi:hypothetical protein